MATTLRSPVHGPWEHSALARLLQRTLHAANEPVTELEVGADEARSLHVAAPGTTFSVLAGSVLVTCEGDVEDHVLAAGETYTAARRGHHVIAGLAPSRVRISAA